MYIRVIVFNIPCDICYIQYMYMCDVDCLFAKLMLSKHYYQKVTNNKYIIIFLLSSHYNIMLFILLTV